MEAETETKIQRKADFAARLNQILKEKGEFSAKSPKGVSVSNLCKIAECSAGMARRYISGQSLPEYETLVKIANWLNVEPNWLMHGEQSKGEILEKLDRTVLFEILLKLKPALVSKDLSDNEYSEVIQYAIEVYETISNLRGDFSTKKNAISLMINSILSSYKTSK